MCLRPRWPGGRHLGMPCHNIRMRAAMCHPRTLAQQHDFASGVLDVGIPGAACSLNGHAAMAPRSDRKAGGFAPRPGSGRWSYQRRRWLGWTRACALLPIPRSYVGASDSLVKVGVGWVRCMRDIGGDVLEPLEWIGILLGLPHRHLGNCTSSLCGLLQYVFCLQCCTLRGACCSCTKHPSEHLHPHRKRLRVPPKVHAVYRPAPSHTSSRTLILLQSTRRQ